MAKASISWSRKRQFERPVQFETPMNRPSINADFLGPIGNAKSLSVEGEHIDRADHASAIQGLFSRRSPSAILWSVVAIIVNTLKAHVSGRLAHIGEEVGKFFPSFADLNSSTAVVTVIGSRGVGAASDHVTPARIHRGVFLPAGMPVLFHGVHFTKVHA